MLQARYDANTAASLLQCVMEVVSPPTRKNHQGIAKGITEWEVRVDGLKMKHDEELSATIKIAVFIGMLPREYQDMCFQQASVTGVEQDMETKYIELRDKNHEHSKPTCVHDYPNTHGYRCLNSWPMPTKHG